MCSEESDDDSINSLESLFKSFPKLERDLINTEYDEKNTFEISEIGYAEYVQESFKYLIAYHGSNISFNSLEYLIFCVSVLRAIQISRGSMSSSKLELQDSLSFLDLMTGTVYPKFLDLYFKHLGTVIDSRGKEIYLKAPSSECIWDVQINDSSLVDLYEADSEDDFDQIKSNMVSKGQNFIKDYSFNNSNLTPRNSVIYKFSSIPSCYVENIHKKIQNFFLKTSGLPLCFSSLPALDPQMLVKVYSTAALIKCICKKNEIPVVYSFSRVKPSTTIFSEIFRFRTEETDKHKLFPKEYLDYSTFIRYTSGNRNDIWKSMFYEMYNPQQNKLRITD